MIVFGEHAVVYGHPAVACSLPRGAKATLSASDDPRWTIAGPDGPLQVDDTIRRAVRQLLSPFDLEAEQLDLDLNVSIPVGAGLGSSAAMATAMARSAAKLRGWNGTKAQSAVAEAVSASEAVFHGTPSGIDQRACVGDDFFSFSKAAQSPKSESIEVEPRRWIVARVAPPASTSTMVESVAALRRRRPALVNSILENFAATADAGARALEAGRWREVGELMDLNQGLLNAVGVSTPALERACAVARDHGALGAKLTGAGGGGCIIAVGADDDTAALEQALAAHGDVYPFLLPPEESLA